MEQKIKLIAMDLDGTLSDHKQFLPEENKKALKELSKRYKLLMVGAGNITRIFNQLESFPIDIIGNYGMQYGEYDEQTKTLKTVKDISLPVDKESVIKRIEFLRNKHGFTKFAGDSVEFHASGCITFAILGTKAEHKDKIAFDPDRSKRRAIYQEVVEVFSEYNVFVGGSSSFDMSPKGYNKVEALRRYCKEKGVSVDSVVFIGDDYGMGGNDESVYKSEFKFLTIDNYKDFPKVVENLLK